MPGPKGMRNGMAKKKAKPVKKQRGGAMSAKKMRGGGMAMKDKPPGMKNGGEAMMDLPPKAKVPPKKMRGGGMAMKDKPPGMRGGGAPKKKAKPIKRGMGGRVGSGSRVRSSSSKPL